MNLIKYIWASIKHHRGKYLSAILAISFSVGCVFGLSIYADQLDDSIQNVFFVDESALFVAESNTTYTSILPVNSRVDASLSEEISAIPGVQMAFGIIFREMPAEFSISFIRDSVVGLESVYASYFMQAIEFKTGRLYENPYEAVIGANFMDGNLTVGDTLELHGHTVTIVGILEEESLLFDQFMFMELEDAQEIFEMQEQVSAIYVMVNPEVDPQGIIPQIEDLSDDIAVIDHDTIDSFLGYFFEYLDLGKVVLIVVPVFVSALILFSMLMFIVTTRFKEYGILKSMGISNGKIISMLLAEVFFITTLGFLLGFFIGWGFFAFTYPMIITRAFTWIELGHLYFQFLSFDVVLQAFLITQAMNLVISIIPSKTILQKDVIEALRKGE